ncbi:nuclear transport factor 2 family protein [Pseudonocardia oroxyli]|uniref:SnoaL-like domain-containing protein n=1 Tax=Pseudonocardia oroxyli TaxID=366584 RepID=A0A1G7TM05_PSEOR|nr:nuclear transport factor 2 family protein [Pseudonocardia oroxyli]SDG36358.1 SnoaL-like domain-containing protein [Pseudonocardia oroxyli]
MDVQTEAALVRLLATSEIRDVVHRYSRGIDRRDLELVRSCYHADAQDEHGDFSGGVEEFLQHALAGLSRCERTMHLIGNVLVEVEGERARCESYALAFHRLPAGGERPARDRVVALRYLDLFTRRGGEWRIQVRRCVCEWTRTDPVGPGWDFPPGWLRGGFAPADPISEDW